MLILHGPNTVASRERLFQEIGRFEGEVVRLEGDHLTPADLQQALTSDSFFEKKRLVVIEGLFSRRQSKAKTSALAYLKTAPTESLILWEGKKIDGRILAPLKAETRLFELAGSVFKFVEALVPENHQAKLRLLAETLVKDPPEMVFGMTARQIRLLLMVTDPPKEKLKLAPWQIARLKAQADRFTPAKLLDLHRQLLEIDVDQKTGRSPFDLRGALELWLVSF